MKSYLVDVAVEGLRWGKSEQEIRKQKICYMEEKDDSKTVQAE